MSGTRLLPTGRCWCGCGAEVDLGSFFAAGHDKRAEARVIMEIFGGVPQFLAAFGRAPEHARLMDSSSTHDMVTEEARVAVLRAVAIKLDEIKTLLQEFNLESKP